MAHKGVREWTSEELSSVALGQNGFHIIKGSGETTAASKGITYWVAIKAVDSVVGVQARSYGDGDDFAISGTQNTTAGNNINIADGDIIYGAFDRIYMDQSAEYIVAYIGK